MSEVFCPSVKRMYGENVKSINAFVGCLHECVYCKPSFQRQMKRQKCLQCKRYEPHFHPERLRKKSPRTVDDQFVFFPSSGDPAFATVEEFQTMLSYALRNPLTTFLIQTKAPNFLTYHRFPHNIILDITLETNLAFYDTPSKFKSYNEISLAPSPFTRVADFYFVQYDRKAVTIEPILQFDDRLVDWITPLKPEFVYVGYDNHNCKLPEPPLAETLRLIDELSKFTEVRLKTIRPAWFEK